MYFKLTAGDWSGDGHDKTAEYTFESTTHTFQEIKSAYDAAVNKIGLSTDDFANDYEDNSFPEDMQKTFKKAGVKEEFLPLYMEDRYEEDKTVIFPEELAVLWLEIAKTELPGLSYKRIQLPSADVGGYGCFR